MARIARRSRSSVERPGSRSLRHASDGSSSSVTAARLELRLFRRPGEDVLLRARAGDEREEPNRQGEKAHLPIVAHTHCMKRVLAAEVKLREVWAWSMYDFANSAYTTVVITAVFGAYFVGVVSENKPWATFA